MGNCISGNANNTRLNLLQSVRDVNASPDASPTGAPPPRIGVSASRSPTVPSTHCQRDASGPDAAAIEATRFTPGLSHLNRSRPAPAASRRELGLGLERPVPRTSTEASLVAGHPFAPLFGTRSAPVLLPVGLVANQDDGENPDRPAAGPARQLPAVHDGLDSQSQGRAQQESNSPDRDTPNFQVRDPWADSHAATTRRSARASGDLTGLSSFGLRNSPLAAWPQQELVPQPSNHPVLESVEEHQTTRQAIFALIEDLREALDKNQDPDIIAGTEFLNLLVKSEQVNHPEFNIKLLQNDYPLDSIFNEFVGDQPPSEPRWSAVVRSGNHCIAASISRSDHDSKHISIVFMESMSLFDKTSNLEGVRRRLDQNGYRFIFAYVNTSVQHGGLGCTFFALKNIKYMASSRAIADHHTSKHKEFSRFTAGEFYRIQRMKVAGLEPVFFKHCTSEKVMENYLESKPPEVANESINRKNETLRGRVTSNIVQRAKIFEPGHYSRFSNSIEKLRIKKLEQIFEKLNGSPELDELYVKSDDDIMQFHLDQ